ncbi:MAG TPA: ECF-type sigma factor [Edaphobacter sp.]|nr:ECF-type sigma factor [Edaphobacter sp.]
MSPELFLTDRTTGIAERGDAEEQRRALNQLFAVTYQELRRLASKIQSDDPRATLNPTALVNEAWFKLAEYPALNLRSKLDFKRLAAHAMRQLLIESARRRNAGKRGRELLFVTFDESLEAAPACARDLIALDTALDALTKISPRQALMVEYRFFGGLETPEIAAQLGISEATVLRDWRAAKAWLAAELRSGPGGE